MKDYSENYLTGNCKMCEYWEPIRGCTISQPSISCSYYIIKRQQEIQSKFNKYKENK